MLLQTVSLTSLSFLLFYNFTYYIWFEIHVYKVFPLSIIEEEEFTFHCTSSPSVSDPFYHRNRPFDSVRLRIRSFNLVFAYSRSPVAIIDRVRSLSSLRRSNHITIRLQFLSHFIFHHTSCCRRKGYLPRIILVLL